MTWSAVVIAAVIYSFRKSQLVVLRLRCLIQSSPSGNVRENSVCAAECSRRRREADSLNLTFCANDILHRLHFDCCRQRMGALEPTVGGVALRPCESARRSETFGP